MKKLPYTKLEKSISRGSFLIVCMAYIVRFTGVMRQENDLFALILLSFLYVFLLLFEYYPQTTNIVTSGKYNNASPADQQRMEHRIRQLVCSFRCILAIAHVGILYTIIL